MATITNNTLRPIVLPTRITVARGETLTVENIDLTNNDNRPTLASLVACGDVSIALDPEEEPAPAPEAVATPAADPAPEAPTETAPKGVKS